MNRSSTVGWFEVWLVCAGVAMPAPGQVDGRAADPLFALTIERQEGQPAADMGVVEFAPFVFEAARRSLQMTARDGQPVACQILWSAPAEPVAVVFDQASRPGPYEVRPGPGLSGATTWTPHSGVTVETRPYGGGPIRSLAAMRDLWNQSAPPMGRSLAPNVFDAFNPHGPTRNFMAWYRGFFSVSEAGEYGFAAMADNACFLLVDGNPIVEWAGKHHHGGGRRGEHNGSARLNAGLHTVEFYRVQEEDLALGCVAWRKPGTDRFRVMPPAAFRPVALCRPVRWRGAGGRNMAYFDWQIVEHTDVDGTILATVEFKALPVPAAATYRWTFDDGGVGEGPSCRHTFPRPGIRSVRLNVMEGDRCVAELEQKLSVHPRWAQLDPFPWDAADRQKRALAAANLSAAPLPDLVALATYADTLHDQVWLAGIGDALLQRKDATDRALAPLFYRIAFALQDAAVREYDRALRAFQTALDLKPADRRLEAKANLHMAGLLIHGFQRLAEAERVLAAADAAQLDGEDQRLLGLFEADLLMLKGRRDAAMNAYGRIGGVVAPADVPASVRRAARLESARQYIERRQYDDAWAILKNVEWEQPLERVSARTAIPIVKVHMGRKEYPYAFSRCMLLLNADPPGEVRAEVYLMLIDVEEALGAAHDAADIARKLVEEFPNSEAAARVRERKELLATPGKHP